MRQKLDPKTKTIRDREKLFKKHRRRLIQLANTQGFVVHQGISFKQISLGYNEHRNLNVMDTINPADWC